MAWPLSQDYNEAIQDPASSFADPELKQGSAAANALGIPMPRSGNFADVYEFTCGPRKWAVKCFTRQIPGLRERYKEISAYLKKTSLPFMVDFTYLEQGLRVRGEWYPVLKMQWVEGFTLNQFVKDSLTKPQLLDVLGQIWIKLAEKLGEMQIAHCDLQHGNVLLVPGRKAGSVAVKLVDYDGMCIPALTLLKTIEVGHPNFQHPQRARDGIYNLEVDRFSHLVIYTAVRALQVAGKPLWDKYDNGDNLLFKAVDFEAPQKSPLLAELLRSEDAAVRQLAETMLTALRQPLERAPLLHQLAATLPPPGKSTAVTRSVPAPEFRGLEAAPPRRARGMGGLVVGVLVAAGFGLLTVAAAGAALFFYVNGRGDPNPVIAQKDGDKPPPDEIPPEKTPPDVPDRDPMPPDTSAKQTSQTPRRPDTPGTDKALPAPAPDEPEQGTASLRKGLKDAEPKVRSRSATLLGGLGIEAKSAVPELIAACKDPDAMVRAAAVEALGRIGPAADAAIPVLVEAITDRDEQVPARAVEALKRITAEPQR